MCYIGTMTQDMFRIIMTHTGTFILALGTMLGTNKRWARVSIDFTALHIKV